jgi:uncharacterized membrane protein SpoIIM required for sporulation
MMDTLILIGGIIFIVFLVISLGVYSYMLYSGYQIKKRLEKYFGKTAEKIIDKKLGKTK